MDDTRDGYADRVISGAEVVWERTLGTMPRVSRIDKSPGAGVVPLVEEANDSAPKHADSTGHRPRILFGLTTDVRHVMGKYEPVISALKSEYGAECNAVIFGRKHPEQEDLDFLDPFFTKVYENPFSGNPRVPQGRLPTRLYGVYRLFRALRSARREFARILRQMNPDVLVIPNDRSSPYTDFIKVSSRLEIPTILLQGAIRKDLASRPSTSLKGRMLRRMIGHEPGVLHGQGGCTRVAVWGNNGVDYYTAVGVPLDRIAITGSPRMDAFVSRYSHIDRRQIRDRINVTDETLTILFATSPMSGFGADVENQYLVLIRKVIERVDSINEGRNAIRLLVKPHPMEIDDFRQNGIAETCERSSSTHYLPDWPIDEALVAADRVLIFNSTTVLEATLVGKAVGVLNPHRWDLGVDYVQKGLASELRTDEDMESFLAPHHSVFAVGDPGYYISDIGDAAKKQANLIVRLGSGAIAGSAR